MGGLPPSGHVRRPDEPTNQEAPPRTRGFASGPWRNRTSNLGIKSWRLGARFGSVEPDSAWFGRVARGQICRVGDMVRDTVCIGPAEVGAGDAGAPRHLS